MTMQVIEFEKARITQRVSAVTLGASFTVVAETAAGTAPDNPDVHLTIIASGATVLDGKLYPGLAAVWENDDDDAAFANL